MLLQHYYPVTTNNSLDEAVSKAKINRYFAARVFNRLQLGCRGERLRGIFFFKDKLNPRPSSIAITKITINDYEN